VLSREELLAAVVDGLDDAVNAVLPDGTVISWNRAAERVYGYRASEIVGRSLSVLLPPEERAVVGNVFDRLRRGENIAPIDTVRVRKDGSRFDATVTISPVLDATGALVAASAVVRDVTDQKRALAALREKQLLTEEAQALAHVGTWTTGLGIDDEGSWSSECYRIFGVDPSERITLGTFVRAVHPDDLPVVEASMRATPQSNAPGDIEFRIVRPNGSVRLVRSWFVVVKTLAGEPIKAIGVLQDVTDQRRIEATLRQTEEQLRQAQKMEAVGRLAGGVAHDFNNLLTVILSCADVLIARADPEHPPSTEIFEMRRAAARAAELTRQLLAFSRKQVLRPRTIDLNKVLSAAEQLIHRMLGEAIDLAVSPGANIHMVFADPGQIEQVLLNLAVNARDAMPEGGRLTIETDNVVLSEAYAAQHAEVAPGAYVMLAVSDTGVGMDEATQARAFEPFFTTKQDKGTGLGLATVYGIVKQTGGHIWVYSEPGRGTTFKMYLPRAEDGAVDDAPAAPVAPGNVRGTETVLLVEDEAQVRQVLAGVLRQAGYAVFDTDNPGDALLVSEQVAGRIHLLVTDVVMPRMTGRQMAERLARSRPDMKVLYMSGYTDNAIVHHGMLDRWICFIEKPITPDTLLAKVREVLDSQ
jgi:two-component system, cell cycle sensor histidine kinase and response regulator CckA